MGVNIELYKYNYDELVNELMKHKEINNKEVLESILLAFGEKIEKTYILLKNELYEDNNSYYNVMSAIDNYFKCSVDWCDDGIYDLRLDANTNISLEEAEEKLGIELTNWDIF